MSEAKTKAGRQGRQPTLGGIFEKHPRKSRVGVLPGGRKWTIYAISAGVWTTGGLWLIYHYFVTAIDEFGFESVHPLEKWWLIAHALFGLWAAWMFGVLWINHIKLGWNTKTRWLSGGSLFLVVLWLTLTGYLLYYLGDPEWRNWTSVAHWVAGLAGLVVFLLHMSFRWARRSHHH